MQREKNFEDEIVDKLVAKGWTFVESTRLMRDVSEPLIIPTLSDRIETLNQANRISSEEVQRAVSELKLAFIGSEGAKKILRYFKQGIPLKFEFSGTVHFVHLFDYENPNNNEFVVSRQVYYTGAETIKVDIILYVNGIPIVDIECKDPTNAGESWENAYRQIKSYEQKVPELYKYVQLGVAVESIAKYFPIVSWQDDVTTDEWRADKKDSIDSIIELLAPTNLLDLLCNFTFIREEHSKVTKVLPRYMQFRAANKIYARVTNNIAGKETKNKGLIWHWQGSGKTLTMIFAAQKLFRDRLLANPTLLFIVDRDELQTQLSDEYAALDLPKAEVVGSIERLKEILSADSFGGERGIFIVLIHKFRREELEDIERLINAKKAEDPSHGNNRLISRRKNVVCLVDEGHRTEYGLLATQMRRILKNAFFFAFTGTPIQKKGKDTYLEFSYRPDELYLDKYFIEESVRDNYTRPITYETRLDRLHLEKKDLDAFLKSPIEELGEERGKKIEAAVRRKLNKITLFLENPTRINEIAPDIAEHFRSNIDGRFKAMMVTGSRKACVLYKRALDQLLPPRTSEAVFSEDPGKNPLVDEYMDELRKRNQLKPLDEILKDIRDKFKEEEYPKILIVTDMLIAGFDAPVAQTMYLDKVLKEHRLLQAIARTNRPYNEKEVGLVIDYVGITKELEKAFAVYDKLDMTSALVAIEALQRNFRKQLKSLTAMFEGVQRRYDRPTLIEALRRVMVDRTTENSFVERYKELRRLYELLGADESKLEYAKDYAWLTAVHTFYVKQVLKKDEDANIVTRYYKRTLDLIYKETKIDEIQKLPARVVIDAAFVQTLRDKTESKEVKAANLAFALNKLVLVDHHQTPVYETLIERVERLMKMWRERKVDLVLREGTEISEEIVQLQDKQAELGLSDLEMSTWLTLKRELGIEDNPELIDELRKTFNELRPRMIPGWPANVELRKMVEARLREFIFKNLKGKYKLSLEKVNQLHKRVSENIEGYESNS